MPDQAGPAPEGKGIPLWVMIGGAIAVALFLWNRNKSAGQNTSTGSALVPGVATDPNTGLPIDPLTGLPYITNPQQPPTNESWALGAEQWLAKNGVSASLANQAIVDYLNGNTLNANESDALNKVLGGYGFPPTPIPFFGNPVVPKTTPTPAPKPLPQPTPTPIPKPSLPKVNAASFPQFISAVQQKLVPIPKGGGVLGGAPVYAIEGSVYGPLYAQGAPAASAYKSGGQLYTLPQFKSYIVQPKAA